MCIRDRLRLQHILLTVGVGQPIAQGVSGLRGAALGAQSLGQKRVAKGVRGVHLAGVAQALFGLRQVIGAQQGDTVGEVRIPAIRVQPQGARVEFQCRLHSASLQELVRIQIARLHALRCDLDGVAEQTERIVPDLGLRDGQQRTRQSHHQQGHHAVHGLSLIHI